MGPPYHTTNSSIVDRRLALPGLTPSLGFSDSFDCRLLSCLVLHWNESLAHGNHTVSHSSGASWCPSPAHSNGWIRHCRPIRSRRVLSSRQRQNPRDDVSLQCGSFIPFCSCYRANSFRNLLAGACIFWCMGLSWIVISLSSIYAVQHSIKAPFALSYWGLVFPNGVFALCSVQLGVVLNSRFFHYFGAIWSSEYSNSVKQTKGHLHDNNDYSNRPDFMGDVFVSDFQTPAGYVGICWASRGRIPK